MARIVLPKQKLLQFAGNGLSEHNRQPLAMTPDSIETKQRMADGTLRKYFVVAKRTYSLSWNNLPGSAAKTIDGLWGAMDIQNFYFANPQPFTLTITYGTGVVETRQVMFSSFENDLAKRGYDDLYNLTISLEEV